MVHIRYRHFRRLLLATSATAIFGCGGGGGGSEPPPADAISVSKTSGDNQQGTVAQPLPNPLVITATQSGTGAAGATVTWSTTSATAGSVTPTSTTTDANGNASTIWALGSVAGSQTVKATVTGATGSPLTFTATAAAGLASVLAKGGGDAQTAETNAALAAPVQASVTDEFGNGVQGVPVAWSATGATVSAPSVPSNAEGVSQVNVTLGATAGPITITADAPGLEGTPLTFTATATEPVPTPTSISVSVRDDNFLSVRNGTVNPAVDTVSAGGTVTWTWQPTANDPHDVTSTGSPSFTGHSTAVQPPPFTVTFTSPGTYSYYCTQHGAPTSGMRGRIVVK
jgi:plastocyanin